MASINLYRFFFNRTAISSASNTINVKKQEKLCEACGTEIEFEKRNCPDCGAMQIGTLSSYC